MAQEFTRNFKQLNKEQVDGHEIKEFTEVNDLVSTDKHNYIKKPNEKMFCLTDSLKTIETDTADKLEIIHNNEENSVKLNVKVTSTGGIFTPRELESIDKTILITDKSDENKTDLRVNIEEIKKHFPNPLPLNKEKEYIYTLSEDGSLDAVIQYHPQDRFLKIYWGSYLRLLYTPSDNSEEIENTSEKVLISNSEFHNDLLGLKLEYIKDHPFSLEFSQSGLKLIYSGVSHTLNFNGVFRTRDEENESEPINVLTIGTIEVTE